MTWKISSQLSRSLHLQEVVDLARYPLLSPSSSAYKDLVTLHQSRLAENGVTTLPGLVTSQALDTAVQEVERKAEQSYTMETDHNIYLTESDWDKSQGKDHVSNRRLDTKVRSGHVSLLLIASPPRWQPSPVTSWTRRVH